ncbi:MAG TPA: DUF2147 domain-containing protein [Flavobacteriia bacterium]|nr:DUF2147 domain-containing protein [Flavobacteriia bacterium]
MKKIALLVIAVFWMLNDIEAQSVFGKWKTIDADTGKPESIVEIYKKDGKAYAKIIKILNKEDENRVCEACKGNYKNKPILGMVLFNGLKHDGKEWNDGKILDPKNGKYYKCYISLVNNNKLKLRGYIGISLLGRTEYWYRVNK